MEDASAARLRIIQITDVYTLKNFPHLKTLVDEKRAEIRRRKTRIWSQERKGN